MSDFELSLYRCIACSGALEVADAALRCSSCEQRYPVEQGVLDTLVRPSEAVISELRGTAVEHGLAAEQWREVKVRPVPGRRDLDALLASTHADPGQYYQQTTKNFEQALSELPELPRAARVLEIGADYDYYFLKRFAGLGAKCVALNVRFSVEEPDSYRDWPEKVLADMNELPFRDAVFDRVLMSATSHHSADLELTLREAARVLVPGGAVMVLNDPVSGWFKHTGAHRDAPAADRHHEIHENEYSFARYLSAFLRAGLVPKFLFSAYHSHKLQNPGELHPHLRFATLGRALALPWKNRAFRSAAETLGIVPAHIAFGFPLNAVAVKRW